MKRWHGPAWAGAGAVTLAVALYAAGPLGTRVGPDPQAEKVEKEPDSRAVGVVRIDAATQQRLGIAVDVLAPSGQVDTLDGFARGLDAAPLAAIIAEIDTAQAAADASRAEAQRLAALYHQDVSASRRSAEAALAQARGDAARVRLAQQRIGLEFGPGLLRLGIPAVRQLASEIATGQAALVRIDVPGANLPAGSSVRIGTSSLSTFVRVIGPAGSADAKLQSAGALAILRGPLTGQSLAARVLPASVAAGSARGGILVPSAAVVRFQGQMWVYKQVSGGFLRVALQDAVEVDDGWLVQSGLTTGDRVAVRGGAGLLALDLGGTGQVGANQKAEED